ncbi:MAG: anthrone oxygenase family protein [Pseudomonadota bacterium]
MNNLPFVLTLCSVLGCGLMAGVFFAFSTFVMRALARIQPAQGIEVMQSINRTVINPWFLGVFLGTAAVCILLAGSALWRWHQPSAVYLLAGSLLYLIGTVLVTIVFHVPMNDALESVEPASNDASGQWAGYLPKWTAWNHVRTTAALLGAASLTLALW